MGFGYLLVGYLLVFILRLLLAELGFGGFALLFGYALMLRGLNTLSLYQKNFRWAFFTSVPLLATALWESFRDLDALFSWGVPIAGNATVAEVVGWAEFFLILFFHFALLAAIRTLSAEVGLPHIGAKAVRNALFVLLYAILFALTRMPNVLGEETVRYLSVPLILSDLLFILLDLFLFLSCAKNICPEGEDEPERVHYKWNFLNKIEDAYEKKQNEAVERAVREAKERQKKKQEARERKENERKNKK